MAYDAVRRQLDQLMGVDRNELPSNRSKKDTIQFDDPRVCKHYLLGLCPSLLTVKRRGDSGPCTNIHDDNLVKRFNDENAAGRVRDVLRWQASLAQICRTIVADEDRRIQGVARRLKVSLLLLLESHAHSLSFAVCVASLWRLPTEEMQRSDTKYSPCVAVSPVF
jgi:RNA-binding protein Luc7-like 2